MKSRKYNMAIREQAKNATREAILRAAIDTVMAERSFSITLPAVAERADVAAKTVLRHFGSRDALIEAAWAQALHEVLEERTPPPGDPEAALRVLIEHYERRGRVGLVMLATEQEDARAQRMSAHGRLHHRAWVEEVFGPQLPEPPAERSRLIDVLVVATDVYSWKLLRLDRGLSVEDVHDRMLLMTQSVLTARRVP